MPRRLRLVLATLATLACSGDGGRFLVLVDEHVAGIDRTCVYRDALGERAVTIPRWESCAPTLELD